MACDAAQETGLSAPNLLEQELMRLYREHASALSRYAFAFSLTQDGARDAVQQIFLRYFVQRRYGRQIQNPRAWLYVVLRNYLLTQPQTIGKREGFSGNLDHLAALPGAAAPKKTQCAAEGAAPSAASA